MTDTIFALATVRGRSGVAIVRVSGPDAYISAEQICGTLPTPRRTALRRLSDPIDGQEIDRGVVLLFAEGHSYTGEKTAEYQIHGGIAVQDRLLNCLSRISNHRLAQPGEFTRRAFENGQLDLTQIEGLSDLIDAETDLQRRQALRVMEGGLSRLVDSWRTQLIRVGALINATIDFADEELPQDVLKEATALLQNVADELRNEIAGSSAAQQIRDGFEVAIVGPPNVGKSTLLNAIAKREAAITSEIAGTTRDVIEVRMDLSGLPVLFLDTAGMRDAQDPVESIGIERARNRATTADLRVFLTDDDDGDRLGVEQKEDDLVVKGKADLRYTEEMAVSGLTGAGLPELLARITNILQQRCAGASSAIRLRHRLSMERAFSHLEMGKNHLTSGSEGTDLAAEDVRCALTALSSVIGKVDVEDFLDEIFASFCLGK